MSLDPEALRPGGGPSLLGAAPRRHGRLRAGLHRGLQHYRWACGRPRVRRYDLGCAYPTARAAAGPALRGRGSPGGETGTLARRIASRRRVLLVIEGVDHIASRSRASNRGNGSRGLARAAPPFRGECPTDKGRRRGLRRRRRAIEAARTTDPDGHRRHIARAAGHHHVCYRVDDVQAALDTLARKGVRRSTEAAAPRGRCRVASFTRGPGGVLVELSITSRGVKHDHLG